jgi:hypothetical protein
MGGSLSSNSSIMLGNEIKSIVNNISHNKYQWWTNKDNCMKLELIYKDKLMNLEKNSLLGTSFSLGIPFDRSTTPNNIYDQTKDHLCNSIISHYKKRIELMENIFKSVETTQNMFRKLKKGNVCTSVDGYIDNWRECGEVDGGWIGEEEFTNILKKIGNTNKYRTYLGVVKKFEQNYYVYLRNLRSLVDMIVKDIDNKMEDHEFDIFETNILGLINRMNDKCESFYLIGISLLALNK